MKRLILVICIIFLSGCCNKTKDQIATIEAYFECWNAKDVDCAMALIADDPQGIEIDPGQLLNDREMIRQALERTFQSDDNRYFASNFEVSGNTVTYNLQIYADENHTLLIAAGSSQAVVENGKIVSEYTAGPYQE